MIMNGSFEKLIRIPYDDKSNFERYHFKRHAWTTSEGTSSTLVFSNHILANAIWSGCVTDVSVAQK